MCTTSALYTTHQNTQNGRICIHAYRGNSFTPYLVCSIHMYTINFLQCEVAMWISPCLRDDKFMQFSCNLHACSIHIHAWIFSRGKFFMAVRVSSRKKKKEKNWGGGSWTCQVAMHICTMPFLGGVWGHAPPGKFWKIGFYEAVPDSYWVNCHGNTAMKLFALIQLGSFPPPPPPHGWNPGCYSAYSDRIYTCRGRQVWETRGCMECCTVMKFPSQCGR